MKIKKLSVVALAALFTFTACNKDNDEPSNGNVEGESIIYLQLSRGGTNRDTTEEVADQTAVEFTHGGLFFTKADGTITKRIEISSNGTGGEIISVDELEKGSQFAQVDETTDRVYIVGNVPYNTINTGTNIKEVLEKQTTLLSQNDEKGSVTKATLYGSGILEAPATPQNWDKEATFDVAPIIGRIEIDAIEATGDITGYKLQGIYLNNIYLEVGLDGVSKNPYDIFNNKQNLKNYYRVGITDFDGVSGITGQYRSVDYPAIFEDGSWIDAENQSLGVNGIGAPSGLKLTAGTDLTWAFNYFATYQADVHVIFHLVDVKVNGNPKPASGDCPEGHGYLTVSSFSQGGNVVEHKGGQILKVANLTFAHEDLIDVPEPKEQFNVNVKVNVLPWSKKSASGNIDR